MARFWFTDAGWIARLFGGGTAAPAMPEPMPASDPGDEPARLLEALVDALPLPVAIVGRDGRVGAASPSARLLLPGLAPGKPVELALRDPDVTAAIQATFADGVRRQVEIIERGQVERALRITLSGGPNLPRLGAELVVSVEDLSEMRSVERTRVDFIANASHELRTPLAAIIGFIETLQGPARQDVAARERFLGIMAEQARRMARLVDDLLSLSRIEQRAHLAPDTPVDLAAILREIVDSLSVLAADRSVDVRSAPAAAPVLVPGDRDELLRLVENLVENAIKYGQSGARVEVSVGTEEGQAVLDVRDFGPGIAAEHIPRLTERFYRVDVGKSRGVGGTGLGLAIVKHILLRHRGRLTVQSTPGEGSLFRVWLPLWRG